MRRCGGGIHGDGESEVALAETCHCHATMGWDGKGMGIDHQRIGTGIKGSFRVFIGTGMLLSVLNY